MSPMSDEPTTTVASVLVPRAALTVSFDVEPNAAVPPVPNALSIAPPGLLPEGAPPPAGVSLPEHAASAVRVTALMTRRTACLRHAIPRS